MFKYDSNRGNIMIKKRVVNFKSVLFLLFVILFLSSVNAAGIIVSSSKVEGSVEVGGEAVHILKIKNTELRDGTYKLKPDDFSVVPFSDAVEDIFFEPSSSVLIPAGGEAEVKVRTKFLDSVRPDRNYITRIIITSPIDPNIRKEVALTTYVIPSVDLIDIETVLPSEIVPGKKNEILINLTNKGKEDLNDLDIFYSSSIFNLEDMVSLGGFEKRTIKSDLEIDPLTEKGEYTLSIRLFKDGKIKGSRSFKFAVGQNPDLRERELFTKGFLSSTVEIVRENEGNTEISRVVSYPITSFQRLFTTTEPIGKIINDEKGMRYEWEFTVPPGSIYRIVINTSYRWLFFSILIVLLAIGTVVYLRQKNIIIKKSVFKINESKEGISELKILLHIKNRTHKEIYNIKVIDLLPKVIKPESDFGTLKPSKIQQGTVGMRLIWEIDKLDPGEERIISYKISSKLPLVGKIGLPSALVQYYGKGKRLINVKSNRLVFTRKE